MNLAAFVLASGVLAVTPGPGVVYIVTRTLAQGRAAGLASVAGVAIGNAGNAIGASIGLAALFGAVPGAFTVVRLAGAAYLVWLGIKALRAAPAAPNPEATNPVATATAIAIATGRILRDAAVVALLNPKTALFFVAFLPQFIAPGPATLARTASYGMAFVAIAAVTDSAWVLAAGLAARAFGRSARAGRAGRWITASIYIGLGLWAASGAS